MIFLKESENNSFGFLYKIQAEVSGVACEKNFYLKKNEKQNF